jgi:hypothetical protein
MKIIIPTQTGESFKNKIFKYVEDENLKTWLIRKDSDGNKFLTHKPDQWYDLALIGFSIKQNQLEVYLNWWKGKEPNEDVKGYYIGRFVEILLVHFKNDFINFTISK